MKTLPRILLSFFLPWLCARAEPAFVGFISSKESGIQFVVVPDPGLPPRWIKIGEEIGGYVLVEYRAEQEVLVFKKDGREVLSTLKASKVQHEAYHGERMPFEAAKRLIASREGWESDVTYSVFRRKDGVWILTAGKRMGNTKELNFLPVTAESIPPGTPGF